MSLVTEEISKAWMLLAGLNAGIGTVSVLRWLWWRVSAWSELGAMATALLVNAVMHILGWMGREPFTWLIEKQGFPVRLLIIVALTQVAWVVVTVLTRPEPREKLVEFYRRVRPPGWWGDIPQEAGVEGTRIGWRWLLGWGGGVLLIYGGLFALGGLLLWQVPWLLGGGVACAVGIVGVRLGLKATLQQATEVPQRA